MGERIKEWWRAYRPSKRRVIQLYAALLYNANLKGFISGKIYTGASKYVCVPGLNCYSCPGAVGACPLGALQNALGSADKRMPFYIIGIILLSGIILGRTVCGFLCPFGLIQELLYKIKTPKLKKNRATRAASLLKYFVLVYFCVVIPLVNSLNHIPVPGFCKYICPAGTLEGALALIVNPANSDLRGMLGGLFTLKLVVLAAVICGSVFIFRMFCRFLCPLGALYSLFSRFSVAGVKVESGKCTNCGLCTRHCKMDIKQVGDRECISCGECMSVCPSKAISWKTPVKAPSGRLRKLIAALFLAALLGTLFWFWCSSSDIQESVPAQESPVISLTDGGEFRVEEHRGEVVVINFWATWCGSCVKELPYFEQVDKEYENLNVIAVHSCFVTDDVEKFIGEIGLELSFAADDDNSLGEYYGVSSILPHTVVIDDGGNIVYNSAGSLTKEELKAIVEAAGAA